MENFKIHVKTLQSKEQSSSGKANSAQGSLNSFILWKPKAHYRVNISSPFVFVPSQTSLVHAMPPCFFTIHSNIILPPVPGIFRFPQRNAAHILPLYVPHALPAPFLFDLVTGVVIGEV